MISISKDYAEQLLKMHSGQKRIGFGLEPARFSARATTASYSEPDIDMRS